MIPALVDHLWQSTLFVGAAWVLGLALRKNQAQVRYWVWFTASVKFLIPFLLLVELGMLVPRRPAAPPVQAQWAAVVEQIGEPAIALSSVPVAAKQANRDYTATALAALWACGFATIAICWLVRWKRVHALRRSATRVNTVKFPVPVMFTPGLIEPGIVGILRPVLLLPEGIAERLDRAQLDAILAHELCHVRRRDNLTASIHMVVQAIFWFHPLVWWLGSGLVDERERACDEEVLRIFGHPKAYAEGILNVCKLYVESRLACVSGVTGSNLKKRIETIVTNRLALRLNFGKKLAPAAAATAALAVPIALGVLNVAVIRAQSVPGGTPKWEVVSIRPCESRDPARKGGAGPTPGRLNLGCISAVMLIQQAYQFFPDGQMMIASHFPPIEGGPPWIKSDQYRITAKAEGTPRYEMMNGPMLQKILEDRFKLKIHRETRNIPVYALTAGKGRPKLQPSQDCIPIDLTAPPPAEPPRQLPRLCGMSHLGMPRGSNLTEDFYGVSISKFSQLLNLDRPVIDKTGIDGLFDIHLEFALDDTTREVLPASTPGVVYPQDPTGGTSIFTAIQEQLGLKLESAKGPGEFLVIDHIEKPSEN